MNVIREDCLKNLKGLIKTNEDVFLISNKEAKWDFDSLTQAILDVLPYRQKESLLLSLHLLTRNTLKRKVEILRGNHNVSIDVILLQQ